MQENKRKAFSPIEVKGKTIKNRFIRSAVNDHLGNTDGTVSDAEIEMYDTLGRGEIGVVITGHLSVSPSLDSGPIPPSSLLATMAKSMG